MGYFDCFWTTDSLLRKFASSFFRKHKFAKLTCKIYFNFILCLIAKKVFTTFFKKCRSSFHLNEFFKSHDLKFFFEGSNNWGKCFLFIFFQFFYQIFGIISKDWNLLEEIKQMWFLARFCTIWVPFIRFKKREKHPWRSVILFHGCFSRF